MHQLFILVPGETIATLRCGVNAVVERFFEGPRVVAIARCPLCETQKANIGAMIINIRQTVLSLAPCLGMGPAGGRELL